ncbi:PaaI family thioesterase [Sinimarinibacterium thermocellulolyticum]|uniref:PaaI family thioesterase n=1 Tax=Sinimarinibacterium thermocellulolyticum TaxID=3170016 RepID=A0ABV2AB66_9GAMM
MDRTGFHATLQRRFAEVTPHVAACGMRLTAVGDDGVEAHLPFREDWLGDVERGLIHPGIVTVLVDSACGAAVLARIADIERVATLDLRMDYLRAAVRDLDIHCHAECHRLTPGIAFVRATAWQQHRESPVAVAHAAFVRAGRRAAAAIL